MLTFGQTSQNQHNQKGSCLKDDKKDKTQKQDLFKGLESMKKQQKFQPLIADEDDEYLDEHEEELKFLTQKANQVSLLRQQQQLQQQHAAAANNSRNLNNNGKAINVGNGNANGKKGNLNNSNGGGGAVNMNLGEGKRVNDMSSIMNNLGGGGGLGNGGGFGDLGGFQIPHRNNVPGYGGTGFHQTNGGLPMAAGGYNPTSQPGLMMMNINGGGSGYNNHHHQQQYNNSAAMMMNLQRQAMQNQQPQMMYNRSPVTPPATGYYYNYNFSPHMYNEHPQNYYYTAGGGGGGVNPAAHMFSDENTSSCSVM